MWKAEEKEKSLHSRCTWRQISGHWCRAKVAFDPWHQASPEDYPLALLQSLHLTFFLYDVSPAFTPPAFRRFYKSRIPNIKPLPVQNIYNGFCESWLIHWSIPCFSNWSACNNPWGHWGFILIKAQRNMVRMLQPYFYLSRPFYSIYF